MFKRQFWVPEHDKLPGLGEILMRQGFTLGGKACNLSSEFSSAGNSYLNMTATHC